MASPTGLPAIGEDRAALNLGPGWLAGIPLYRSPHRSQGGVPGSGDNALSEMLAGPVSRVQYDEIMDGNRRSIYS